MLNNYFIGYFCDSKAKLSYRGYEVNYSNSNVNRSEFKKMQVIFLHNLIKKDNLDINILEISTKSQTSIGKKLSALNLKVKICNKEDIIEDIYQKSKTLNKDKKVIGFNLFGNFISCNNEMFNVFYDWLYFNALLQNKDLFKSLTLFDCFTDIEFNNQKSFNTQARAACIAKYLLIKHEDITKLNEIGLFKFYCIYPKNIKWC